MLPVQSGAGLKPEAHTRRFTALRPTGMIARFGAYSSVLGNMTTLVCGWPWRIGDISVRRDKKPGCRFIGRSVSLSCNQRMVAKIGSTWML